MEDPFDFLEENENFWEANEADSYIQNAADVKNMNNI
jgi:hypothetical protein